MSGSTFKRCGCTEVVDGKRRQLGQRCPQLRRKDGSWNPRHGTWTYATSVPGKRGKRQQVVRGGFKYEDEAKDALEGMRARLKRTGGVVNDRLTVGEFLGGWLKSKSDVKASTLRSYQQHITKYLEPALGRLRLAELRVEHVKEALDGVTSSDANRQRVRATLRTALSDAVAQQLISVNPAKLVKIASGKRPRALVWTAERVQRWQETGERPSPVMCWTPAQLGAFLDAAEGDRLYALFHLIAHRGLRRGEACGLGWSDVDLDAGRLTVRRQLVQLGWAVHEDAPKSDAGERTIALDATTVAALRAHRRRQREERMAWGSAWADSGKVFTRADGAALHPATVTERFHEIGSAAELPPVRLHDLRHGAASLMLAAGVPAKVVQETLGHSTIGLTLDTYTSVYTEVAAEAAEAAAALVPRAVGGPRVSTMPAQAPAGALSMENAAGQTVGPLGIEPRTRGLKVDQDGRKGVQK